MNNESLQQKTTMRRIRGLLVIFIVALLASGTTAIPLESELRMLGRLFASGRPENSQVGEWILKVRDAVVHINASFPFIAYGTDWLGFAHFVIAIAFIGPLWNPVKNIWVVEFGIIACALVVPFALVMGGVRGIPVVWRLIDCSFGIFGVIPLWLCRRLIKRLPGGNSLAVSSGQSQ